MTTPRRGIVAAIACAIATPAAMIAAPVLAETFAGTYAPRAEAVAEGIWVVRGADEDIRFTNGGAIANSVLIATGAGTVLVDPGPSLSYGKALAALAQQVTGKPVVRVYVTHLHPDHGFGAAAFAPAIVHVLPATRHDIERDGAGFSDAFYRMLADWMAGTTIVVPQGDVTEGTTEIGGRTLRMFAMDGHSGGDLVILDERTGTLIAGDLVFHDRAPSTPHADIENWLAALDRLDALPKKVVIPGHGPVESTGASIAQTRDWLTWLRASLRQAVASGQDMGEAGAMPIPERFSAMKVARYELQRSVSHFYPRLEAEIFPEVGR